MATSSDEAIETNLSWYTWKSNDSSNYSKKFPHFYMFQNEFQGVPSFNCNCNLNQNQVQCLNIEIRNRSTKPKFAIVKL